MQHTLQKRKGGRQAAESIQHQNDAARREPAVEQAMVNMAAVRCYVSPAAPIALDCSVWPLVMSSVTFAVIVTAPALTVPWPKVIGPDVAVLSSMSAPFALVPLVGGATPPTQFDPTVQIRRYHYSTYMLTSQAWCAPEPRNLYFRSVRPITEHLPEALPVAFTPVYCDETRRGRQPNSQRSSPGGPARRDAARPRADSESSAKPAFHARVVAMTKLRPDLLRDLQAGLAFHRANLLDNAEAAYRKVLKRVPKDPDALNLLGVITQERGRPAEAVQLISSALRGRRNFPEALTNLARAQRAAGDPDGAATSARRAIALAPDLAEAYVQLGRALLDLKDDAGAADACSRAVELAPGSLDAQVNLAAALTRQKDYLAAAQVYQEAHRLKPDRAETLTDFATALTDSSDTMTRSGVTNVRSPLRRGDPRVHANHAVTLKRAQDPVAAVDACRRALALAPDRADTLLLLGSALATLGRFAEAVDSYRRVLELDADCAEARRAIVAAGERIADAAELARLRATADNAEAPPPQRAAAGYALGALLDEVRDYDTAFAYYAMANRLRRASRNRRGERVRLSNTAAARGRIDRRVHARSL